MTSKIKILYIIDNVKKGSGVSSVIMNYIKKINKESMQIDFLLMTEYKNSYKEELKQNGSNIFYCKNTFSIKNIKKIQKETENFFEMNKYDIVELHAPTFSFIFLKAAKKQGVPVRIVHSHSTIHSSNKVKNLLSIILNINLKKYANVFFSCSNKSGLYWYGKKICASDNYFIIKNGINKEKFRANNEMKKKYLNEYKLNDNFVVGFVGRISDDKNLPFLLDVMKDLVKINNKIKLIIIGDGDRITNFKKMTKEYEDNILFLGQRNNVNELLNCFDLLLLPSKREGLPMVVVEAQMTGIPCLISNTVTDEVNIGGCTFLELKKDVWINEILNFKKKKVNINKKIFDIDNCTLELEEIYKSIIKKKV